MSTKTYWVTASNQDQKDLLESLGVKVGPWDPNDWCFLNCTINPEALDRLDKHWGDKFFWGPEQ